MVTDRRTRHGRVSALLAARSDGELAALVAAGRSVQVGVGGGSAVVDVDGAAVFVKRIPLTDRELAHPRSTANLFDLPVFCQYGIGGTDFNGWRELAANLTVTEGVLAGETESFPLLHHWRVLPGRPPVADEHADIEAVVARMGGAPQVRTRMAALAAATRSLVLFWEYVPEPMTGWLRADPVGRAEPIERQLAEIAAFLHGRALLHMDAHFDNFRTDGERIYLTDFGLATSPRFDLSAAEREFVARHAGHDADLTALHLVNWLVMTACGVPVPATGGPAERNEYVRRCAAGDIPPDVPPPVARVLRRHAATAARLNAFYWRLFDGDVRAEYPAAG
jgi:hypothetical protein